MNIKKDFIIPIIVLSLICLFVSGALAIVNYYTNPVIKTAAKQREDNAMKEIIPQADEFIPLDINKIRLENDFPKTVTSIYETSNNAGYIFLVTTPGYGGDIIIICGITPEGKIIKTAVLEHNETQGLGTPIFDHPHAGQYWGINKTGIESIDVISGATITSNAYKNGIRDALTAFDILITREAR
ncbi:MAG: FMN-binding protein [Treponema sp.]|nr:FMN-binding protein [Treponema sp.]